MDYELISPRDESASALVQVLMNRGFSKTEIVHYLNTTEADLVDPSTIEHIAEGAAMLRKHMDNNSKVFIQVDSDVDGYTSSSILMNYIHDYMKRENILLFHAYFLLYYYNIHIFS